MNCDNCPHMERIREALKPCQTCDNGSHHGKSHVQATDFTLSHRKDDVVQEEVDPALANEIQRHDGSAGVTNLGSRNEAKLRMAMSTLFGLDPVELLLVQHLFLGGDLATFSETERAVAQRILRYRGEPRGRAFQLKEAVIRKWPQIAPIFKRLVRPSSKAAKGRTKRDSIYDQLNAEKVTPDLFEFSAERTPGL